MASQNGRITNAIIMTKLEYIESHIENIDVKIDKSMEELDDNESRITKLEGKTNNFAIFQSLLSITVAAIAGFLGTRK